MVTTQQPNLRPQTLMETGSAGKEKPPVYV